MISDILLIILGLTLVVFGANWLVDGSCAVAQRAGISEFVIGLTIVGFGTSCPELVVSLAGAIKGNADISVGNVLGSNLFNTLFILGCTALLKPINVTRSNFFKDIPIALFVTALMLALGMCGSLLSRYDGALMMLAFVGYLVLCFKSDTNVRDSHIEDKRLPLVPAAGLILAGLSALIVGGDFFVDHASSFAKSVGISDKIIAVTLLAGGTSLPELATCIVAAAKGKGGLALGNILGSNVFNILLILGLSSVVTPLSFANVTWVDAGALVASVVALLLCSVMSGKRHRIGKAGGALLVLLYGIYMSYLLIK